MEMYTPRKLKLKAWNLQTKLMMRLSSIECVKGELHKKDHILLQFTEYVDAKGEEIYDHDIIHIDGKRYLVGWEREAGWMCRLLEEDKSIHLQTVDPKKITRLCSYFETSR